MNVYDKFSPTARINEFEKANGGRAESAVLGGWIWYSNGATRETDPLGAMIDPPTDEYARLSNVVRYHQARLNQAVRHFDDLKENLMGAHPDREALDELKKRQATVSERNQELEQAKKNLANTEEGKRREANRLLDAEQHAKRQQFREDVKMVRI